MKPSLETFVRTLPKRTKGALLFISRTNGDNELIDFERDFGERANLRLQILENQRLVSSSSKVVDGKQCRHNWQLTLEGEDAIDFLLDGKWKRFYNENIKPFLLAMVGGLAVWLLTQIFG